MRDSKSLILLLLAIFSLVLTFVVFYYFFNETDNEKINFALPKAGLAPKDSLSVKYASLLNDLNGVPAASSIESDSANAALFTQLGALYQLKNEITAILKNTNSSTADLEIARQKITELQQRVEQLNNRNDNIELENKRLSALLSKLASNFNIPENMVSAPIASTVTAPVTKVNPEPILNSNAGVLSAYNINLKALDAENGDETNAATETGKLVGSFVVKNNLSPFNNTEMMVVLVQPNGRVLQPSPWESGTFSTAEGKKIYSCKVKFDYRKGETKQCNFNINADQYQKGNYMLQLYHNGILVGRLVKNLG